MLQPLTPVLASRPSQPQTTTALHPSQPSQPSLPARLSSHPPAKSVLRQSLLNDTERQMPTKSKRARELTLQDV